MPRFTNSLPPEGKHQGFDLKRTPTTSAIQAIITCEDILVCDTHFWHGRTTPCERKVNAEGHTIDDSMCQACQEKQAWRTHVYVSCFDVKQAEHFIWEATGHAAKPLVEYRDATGTLRGCVLHASRPKATPNGKVVVQTSAANLARITLPHPPDLIRALAVIWRLPAAALETAEIRNQELPTADGHHARQPTLTTREEVLREAFAQVDNAPSLEQLEARKADILGQLATATKSNGHAKKQKA